MHKDQKGKSNVRYNAKRWNEFNRNERKDQNIKDKE